MKLSHLTDETLLNETQSLVKQEREITLKVLHHLREIEKRRLFSKLGYSSLYTYCTQELKYSEASAQRRISSMRALFEMPELEAKIQTGALSLSNLSQAQSYFYAEKKLGQAVSKENKLELIAKLENKSRREAEREIITDKINRGGVISPPPAEAVRVISPTHLEMKMVIENEFEEKLKKLKGLLAHKMPNASSQQILEFALDLAIEKLDPTKKEERKLKAKEAVVKVENKPVQSNQNQRTHCKQELKENNKLKRKAIPAVVKRYIWKKAESKCEICASNYAPQTDHIIPFAIGGTDEPENLRLLCRNCNQRQAIEKLGINKMQRYFCSQRLRK